MVYRNKTYVAFAGEDLHCYRLMEAWRDNKNIDFNFFDAHDICTARDSSRPETIRRRLRDRIVNAKQVVMLISDTTKPKAGRSTSFLFYEVEQIVKLDLPVVFVNLNGNRGSQTGKLPTMLRERYTMSVSFQPKIIKYALDDYVAKFQGNSRVDGKSGPYFYKGTVYDELGL
ncbi:TIR domain-containing protein [Nocardiopsis sp. JB363]|uniref:TIR domain-containing protein n=1 Tax=Nocardiopsis sp. JB363 TaxID=1434837 RepID=UPI000B35FD3C|nr:TIR domain-containing protein [Nocardiopsis sp. JB363]